MTKFAEGVSTPSFKLIRSKMSFSVIFTSPKCQCLSKNRTVETNLSVSETLDPIQIDLSPPRWHDSLMSFHLTVLSPAPYSQDTDSETFLPVVIT